MVSGERSVERGPTRQKQLFHTDSDFCSRWVERAGNALRNHVFERKVEQERQKLLLIDSQVAGSRRSSSIGPSTTINKLVFHLQMNDVRCETENQK